MVWGLNPQGFQHRTVLEGAGVARYLLSCGEGAQEGGIERAGKEVGVSQSQSFSGASEAAQQVRSRKARLRKARLRKGALAKDVRVSCPGMMSPGGLCAGPWERGLG